MDNELTETEWAEMTRSERLAYLDDFNDEAARNFERETGRRCEDES